MIDKIREYLQNNNYNGEGLVEYLNKNGGKAHWCASTTSRTSGIVKYNGTKYYFYCIAPWAMCPNGLIEVEIS